MKKPRAAKSPPPSRTRKTADKPTFPGNEKHLEILKESWRRRSPRFWNQWRQQHPGVVPDLRLDIRRKISPRVQSRAHSARWGKLERIDLAGVHLERASLKDVNLRYANLSSVHAEKANLSNADFRGATLRQGNFRKAICLDGTRFPHANLSEADFTGARMVEANLSQADLTKACFDGATMTSALLNDAVLDETSLLGTKLGGAHVVGTFIRRVKTDARTQQRGLFIDVHVVWERQPGKMVEFVETNDIHVAQFHNIVDEKDRWERC